MKFISGKLFIALLFFVSTALFSSCKSEQSDAEIKAAFDKKAENNVEMSKINASVANGVVTLTGECKDEECRKECAEEVKEIKGVKSVVNNLQIATAAPAVQVSGDDQLRTGVSNVLKSYSTVQADVNDGVVTLRGEIKRDDLQTLLIAVNELKPRKVDNQLAIK